MALTKGANCFLIIKCRENFQFYVTASFCFFSKQLCIISIFMMMYSSDHLKYFWSWSFFLFSLLLPTIKISVSLRKYNHNFKYQYILMATKSVFPSQTVLIFKYVCLYTYLMGFMLMHISTIELNSKTQLYIFDSISFLYSRISQKFFMWGSKNCVS